MSRQTRVLRAAATLGLATGVWGVVALVCLLVLTGTLLRIADPQPLGAVIGPTLLYTGLWAAWTPVLLAIGRRNRLRAPWLRAATAARLTILAGSAALTAFALASAYAYIASAWADAGNFLNLPDAALLFAGRASENLVIAVVVLAGQDLLWRRREARRRELEAVRLTAQLHAARLQALSMELQPHFLFNTLNAISGMVWEDQAKADTMVVQLSELLRRTLEAGSAPLASLEEELHVLRLYLDLQQVRFGDRLRIGVEAPDALKACEVPRFILQPLVENAFQHGLAPKRGRVELTVRVLASDSVLILEVEDNGVGLPPDTERVESTGVGSTRDRLRVLYGTDARVELARREPEGTRVRVYLPRRLIHAPPPTTSP